MAKPTKTPDAAPDDGGAAAGYLPEPPVDTILAKKRLTPEDLVLLDRLYCEVARADDDEAKAMARQIQARVRRCTHDERHPNEPRLTLTVPMTSHKTFFRVKGKRYFGECKNLPKCVHDVLVHMIDSDRRYDAELLAPKAPVIVDIGSVSQSGFIAERARRIAAA